MEHQTYESCERHVLHFALLQLNAEIIVEVDRFVQPKHFVHVLRKKNSVYCHTCVMNERQLTSILSNADGVPPR